MKENLKRSVGLHRNGILFVALLIMSVAQAVHADSINWLPRYYDVMQTVVVQQRVVKRSFLDVDDDGSMLLHNNGRTVIAIGYEANGGSEEKKERLGLAPPHKDNPGFGGINFKLAFTF